MGDHQVRFCERLGLKCPCLLDNSSFRDADRSSISFRGFRFYPYRRVVFTIHYNTIITLWQSNSFKQSLFLQHVTGKRPLHISYQILRRNFA
jgi:hypothetical protein